MVVPIGTATTTRRSIRSTRNLLAVALARHLVPGTGCHCSDEIGAE